jgi:hypothetical protein
MYWPQLLAFSRLPVRRHVRLGCQHERVIKKASVLEGMTAPRCTNSHSPHGGGFFCSYIITFDPANVSSHNQRRNWVGRWLSLTHH